MTENDSAAKAHLTTNTFLIADLTVKSITQVQTMCTDNVCGQCVRTMCTDNVYGQCVQTMCTDNVYGQCVQTMCTDNVFGQCVNCSWTGKIHYI
jgi:hypothetical protein